MLPVELRPRGSENMKKFQKCFIRPLGADNTANPSWNGGQLPELKSMVMLKWSKMEKSLFGELQPCFFQRVDGQGLRYMPQHVTELTSVLDAVSEVIRANKRPGTFFKGPSYLFYFASSWDKRKSFR